MTNTNIGNGRHWRLSKTIGVLLVVFLVNLPLGAQPRPAELRFHVGRAGFLENPGHVSAGASYRHYFGRHGWALEPEYSFMTEGSHQDNMLIMNVVKDLTKPSRRATLYMIMGGGMSFYRSRMRSAKGLGGLGWGMGLKVWASDRFFISPQFRIGREPTFRFSFYLGFTPRR